MAAAIAETIAEQIATRRDLADVSREISGTAKEGRAHTDQVEAKLSARIDQVEARLSARIDQVEARVSQVEARLSAEIRQSEQRQTIRLGAMMAASIAIVATLVKLL